MKPCQSKHLRILGEGCSGCPPLLWVMSLWWWGLHFILSSAISLSFWRCLSRSINFSGNGVWRTQTPCPDVQLLSVENSGGSHHHPPASSTLLERDRLELCFGGHKALLSSVFLKSWIHLHLSQNDAPVTSSSVVLAFPLCLTPAFERLDFLPCQGLLPALALLSCG